MNITRALVALVRDIKTNEPLAIHRTALTTDNPPVRAAIDKMSYGVIKGGAIKLCADDEVTGGLLAAEGIETAMSASLILKFRPVWCLLSASGIENFPVLSGIQSATIAVDRYDNGAGQKASEACRQRLSAGGIEVFRAYPPEGYKDFNDVLMGVRQ
jgi:hypothetical protein